MSLTVEQVEAQCRQAQQAGRSLNAVMGWAFGLDRAWGSVEVRKVWFRVKGEQRASTNPGGRYAKVSARIDAKALVSVHTFNTAGAAYSAVHAECVAMLEALRARLAKPSPAGLHWGHVGDLAAIRSQLASALGREGEG